MERFNCGITLPLLRDSFVTAKKMALSWKKWITVETWLTESCISLYCEKLNHSDKK